MLPLFVAVHVYKQYLRRSFYLQSQRITQYTMSLERVFILISALESTLYCVQGIGRRLPIDTVRKTHGSTSVSACNRVHYYLSKLK